MGHLVDSRFVRRANNAFMLAMVCGGLAATALAAIIVDLGRWFSWW